MGELFKFKMGASVKDRLTGFEGVVTSRSDYMYDANSYRVEARGPMKAERVSSLWVNENRLELVNATIFEVDFPA